MNTRKKRLPAGYREPSAGEGEEEPGDYSDSGSDAALPAGSGSDSSSGSGDSAEEFTQRSRPGGRAAPRPAARARPHFARRLLSRLAAGARPEDAGAEERPELSVRELSAADKLLPAVLQLSESDSDDDDEPLKKTSAQKGTNYGAGTSAGKQASSESENEAQTGYTDVWSKNRDNSAEVAKKSFQQLQHQSTMLEQTKASFQRYSANKSQKEVNVKDLLALGEEEAEEEKFQRMETSGSEVEDWEEVKDSKPIPQSGLQLIVDFPGASTKKSKELDLEMMMRRKINRVKKEYQVYMHKVHVLSWLAHGNYVNGVLNDQEVMAAALTLLPNKNCYPSERVDVDYIIKISKWYRDKMIIKLDKHEHKFKPKAPPLKQILLKQIKEHVATTKKYLVYIFLSMLRALGLQCRIMLNFVTVPIKPPHSELCSLATKNKTSFESKTSKSSDNKSRINQKAAKPPTKKTTKTANLSKSDISQLDGIDDSSENEMEWSDDEMIMQLDGNDDGDVVKAKRGTRATALSLKSKIANNNLDAKLSESDEIPLPKRAKKEEQQTKELTNKNVPETKRSRSRTPKADDISKNVPELNMQLKRNNLKSNTECEVKTTPNTTEAKRSPSRAPKSDTDKSDNVPESRQRTKRNNLKSTTVEFDGSSNENVVETKRSRIKTSKGDVDKSVNAPESKPRANKNNLKSTAVVCEGQTTKNSAQTRSRSRTPKGDADKSGNMPESKPHAKRNNLKSTAVECKSQTILNATETKRSRSRTPKSDVKKSENVSEPRPCAKKSNENGEQTTEKSSETKTSRSRTPKIDAVTTENTSQEPKVVTKRKSPRRDVKEDKKEVATKITERRRRSPNPRLDNIKVPNKATTKTSPKQKDNPYTSDPPKKYVYETKSVKVSSDFFKESLTTTNNLKIPEILINNQKLDTRVNKLSLSRKRSRTSSPSTSKDSLLIKHKSEELSRPKPEKARTRSAPGKPIETSKYFTKTTPNKNVTKKCSSTRNVKAIEEDKQRVSHRDLQAKSPQKGNKMNVTKDLVKLIKARVKEAKTETKKKLVKGKVKSESEDSDYLPVEAPQREGSSDSDFKTCKISPKSSVHKLDRRVLSSDEESVKKKLGLDVWCEVYVEDVEQWIAVDVVQPQMHCVSEIYGRMTHPVSYIVGWDNNNYMKDLTRRYVPHWNTVTRKLRAEASWWEQAIKPWRGPATPRDREENEQLDKLMFDAPLPKIISEYKNHPLYALKRHLLKFEVLYPPEAPPLGFVRGEAVYARECVYTCRSRDTWLKEAKTVKLGEKPYKIVKARPKWDKLSNKVISDIPLEVYGPWQIQDYEPPTAENGIVPRNAYGNVELFKDCMLPKGTVHIKLPNLNKVARKLNIDCAPAMTGFDFHGGWTHPVFDGFVVCTEFEEIITDAWVKDQEEMAKREQEKIEARVYGNWRKLIKGLFIRQRLQQKYAFEDPNAAKPVKKKPKGPRFVVKK